MEKGSRSMSYVQNLGISGRFFVIAGPCVIEGREFLLKTAKTLKEIAGSVGVPIVFKASYDKANRSSVRGFRGPGLKKGLADLAYVKKRLTLPILTDVHEISEVKEAAKVADVLQIPAFLSRQTSLLQAAAKTGRVVNVKKGQFMAPEEMENVADKLNAAGAAQVWLTERGTSFGYHNLVVDYRGIPEMQQTGCPVIFDGTHSVQKPAAKGTSSGGTREHVPTLVRAAVAAGVDGLFLEVHPDPPNAKSDAATQITFETFRQVLRDSLAIRQALKNV
jgi:2-dehydro-3-deoxyphosphooctonate aldolase (KDO 8-P synthase)